MQFALPRAGAPRSRKLQSRLQRFRSAIEVRDDDSASAVRWRRCEPSSVRSDQAAWDCVTALCGGSEPEPEGPASGVSLRLDGEHWIPREAREQDGVYGQLGVLYEEFGELDFNAQSEIQGDRRPLGALTSKVAVDPVADVGRGTLTGAALQ